MKKTLSTLSLLILLTPPLLAHNITGISFESESNFSQLRLTLTGPVETADFILKEPQRLVVDLEPAVLPQVKEEVATQSKQVPKLYLAQFQAHPEIVRTVLTVPDLKEYSVKVKGETVLIVIGKKEETPPLKKKTFKTQPKTSGTMLRGAAEWEKELIASEEKFLEREGEEDWEIIPSKNFTTPPLSLQKKFSLLFKGQKIKASPLFLNQTLMLPAREIFQLAEIPILFDKKEKMIKTPSDYPLKLAIPLSQNFIILNNEERRLATPVATINGKVYLPFFSLVKNLGYGIRVNKITKEIIINPRITKIVRDKNQNIEILSSHPIKAKVSELLTPPRIRIEFKDTIMDTLATNLTEESMRKVSLTIPTQKGESFFLEESDLSLKKTISFPALLSDINFKNLGSRAKLKIPLTKKADYRIFSLKEPDRLIIDFNNTLFQGEILKEINANGIKRIRASQFMFKPLKSRVVIDLTSQSRYQANFKDQTLQIMLIPEKKVKPKIIPKKIAVLKGKIIVIDPGHGGRDPGSISDSGFLEKEFTLDTSLKLSQLLSEAGATVLMTRDDDSTTYLKEIVKFTNRNRAHLFISVHYNAMYKGHIAGTETYYFNRNSKRLAQIIHGRLLKDLKLSDRRLRRIPFYVLAYTKMPAVLVEPLYLTNHREEALILDEKFRQKIAKSLFDGIVSYLK